MNPLLLSLLTVLLALHSAAHPHAKLMPSRVAKMQAKTHQLITNGYQSKLRQSNDVSCSAINGYFVGTFQWLNDKSHKFNAQFTISINASASDKTIYFSIPHSNKTYSNGVDVGLNLVAGRNDYYCDTPGKTCRGPFVSSPVNLIIDPYILNPIRWSSAFGFPNFQNSFTLSNTTGQCTNVLPQLKFYDFPIDPSLFKFCLCCGSYAPDSRLGCPSNPWQPTSPTATPSDAPTTVWEE